MKINVNLRNSSFAVLRAQSLATIAVLKVARHANPVVSVKTVRSELATDCLQMLLHRSIPTIMCNSNCLGLVFLNSTDWRNSDCVRLEECPVSKDETEQSTTVTTTTTASSSTETGYIGEKGLLLSRAQGTCLFICLFDAMN